MIKIAAAQLPTLAISKSRLDYYLRSCEDMGVGLVCFGEYVLNSFFNELKSMPKSMIKEQSHIKKQNLIELSSKYKLELIAPLIEVEKEGFKKVCLRVNERGVKSYTQQALINYTHWNEERFFINKLDSFKLFSFSYMGLKIAVIFGFEAHFNPFWDEIRTKKIDLVLIPCACAFNSKGRWEALLKTRAFSSNVSILRVNRIGKGEKNWDFYGNSFFIDANGDMKDSLQADEGLLVCEVEAAKDAKKYWGFNKIEKNLEKLKNK